MKIAEHMPQGEEQAQPPAGPARGAMPPDEMGQPKGKEPKGDEQEAYERVVLAASDILYSEETMGDILGMLEAGADDPAKAVADAGVFLIGQLDEQSGGTIPEGVIIPAAAEITELVAEMGHQKGIIQVDEQVIGRAGQYLLLNIAELYGDPTEEDIEDIMSSASEEEIQQIVQQQSQFSVV